MRLDGVHTHVGSQLLNVEQLAQAVEPIAKLGTFDVYDLGGGLGVRYTYDEHPPSLDDYADAMVTQARALLPDGARIIVEPGRSMVANSACTVYRITTIKRGVITHVAVDGGMGDNLEVSLTGQRFEATIVNRVGGGETVSVVGRHCESGDQLVDGVPLRRTRDRRPARGAGHRCLLLHDVQPVQRRAPGPGCLRPQRECPAGGPTGHLGRLVDPRCRLIRRGREEQRKTGKMGGMTDLPGSLVELARRYGVATEYEDWTGRHARRRRLHTDRRARRPRRARRHRGRAHQPHSPHTTATTGRARCRRRSSAGPALRRRSGCTSPTAIPPACGSGWRTAASAPACGSSKTTGPLMISTADLVGEATFELPARPAAGLSPTASSGRLVRHQHAGHRLPRVAGAARQAGPEPGMGCWPPSSTACARNDLGASAI